MEYALLAYLATTLINKLFLEESLDQSIPLTSLEEYATSQNNSLDNNQPITTQFVNIPNTTEHVSLQTTYESNPHTNSDALSSIVSQTQTGINASYVVSDDKERQITESSDGPQFNEILKQLNNVFDDTADYVSAELKVVINQS